MSLKMALFLSSKGEAWYEHVCPMGDATWQYRVQVKRDEREYTPLIPIGPGPWEYTPLIPIGPGPYHCDVYLLSILLLPNGMERTEGEFYAIDTCVEFLKAWDIPVDEGWMPGE